MGFLGVTGLDERHNPFAVYNEKTSFLAMESYFLSFAGIYIPGLPAHQEGVHGQLVRAGSAGSGFFA